MADFSSKETLLAKVDTLKHPIDGVLATYENYVLPTAWISEHLGLPGMPVVSAEACTDKYLMRSLFSKAPEKISPDFSVVQSRAELEEFAAKHSFPLILKPASLAKSLLVTKNDSLDELIHNYEKSVELIAGIYKKYAPQRTPKLIIEEYLDGSIHSVDAFVDKNGKATVLKEIVDYQTGYDIGFDDNFHYSRILPSTLSDEDQSALLHCARLGVEALGMKSSPAHIEIIMTKDGPRIVEIGARNGGYRDRMHELANGIDLSAATINTALGDSVDVVAKKHASCGVFELFPKTNGIFTGIEDEDELLQLPSVRTVSVKAKSGAFIGKSSDGYKTAAIIVAANDDAEQFNRDRKFIDTAVSIKTT